MPAAGDLIKIFDNRYFTSDNSRSMNSTLSLGDGPSSLVFEINGTQQTVWAEYMDGQDESWTHYADSSLQYIFEIHYNSNYSSTSWPANNRFCIYINKDDLAGFWRPIDLSITGAITSLIVKPAGSFIFDNCLVYTEIDDYEWFGIDGAVEITNTSEVEMSGDYGAWMIYTANGNHTEDGITTFQAILNNQRITPACVVDLPYLWAIITLEDIQPGDSLDFITYVGAGCKVTTNQEAVLNGDKRGLPPWASSGKIYLDNLEVELKAIPNWLSGSTATMFCSDTTEFGILSMYNSNPAFWINFLWYPNELSPNKITITAPCQIHTITSNSLFSETIALNDNNELDTIVPTTNTIRVPWFKTLDNTQAVFQNYLNIQQGEYTYWHNYPPVLEGPTPTDLIETATR